MGGGLTMGETTTESMNKELQDWIKETRQIPQDEQKHSSKRTPEGICTICEEKEAKFICIKCEQSICADCYFKIIGVCKQCVPESVTEKWEGKSPDWAKILDVQWVD